MTAGKVPSLKLNDGYNIPLVGLGTFQGNYSYTSIYDQALKATCDAINAGYRHMDTAALYDTEGAIGDAMAQKIKEGVVKREEMFITTKLWSTCHRPHLVQPALEESLARLKVSYVDLYLMHWPVSLQPGKENFPKDEAGNVLFDEEVNFVDTWKAMIECQKAGLAKSIGVSNFNIEQLESLLAQSSVVPAVNQVEVNPFFSNKELAAFCLQHNIAIACFSPLGKPSRQWKTDGYPYIFTHPTIQGLAKKYGKSEAQISLRFLTQRGLIVLPKSANAERQAQNIQIFDFELSEEDMKAMWECDMNFRVLFLEPLAKSKEYPFKDFKAE